MVDINKSRKVDEVVSNSESDVSGNTTKEELVEGLLEERLECPYPNHKGYVKVRKSLTPDQQKEMKENIRITDDGKIGIIKMKKKFSMLTAQHNGKDIFDGSYVDKNGKTGIKGVTYLTGRAAEREVDNQGKKLLKDSTEVNQFIDCFPGENTKEKIFNFVKLFGLEKVGYWNPSIEAWNIVGSFGFVQLSKVDEQLSKVDEQLSKVDEHDYVYGLLWSSDHADMDLGDQEFPSPCLAAEDLD